MNLHVSQDPPSLLEANPHLSPALTTVVMRAIRRDPEKRYHSMQDMLHDLQNLEEVKHVSYEPDAPQLNRTGRQIITVAIVLAAIFIVIIAIGLLAQFAHHAAH